MSRDHQTSAHFKMGGGGAAKCWVCAKKEKKIDFQLLAISGGKTGGQTQ